MTATTLLDDLRAIPWTVAGFLLAFAAGLALGLARGAALRATLYAMVRDPFTDKVSTVTVMILGTWLATVGAFYKVVQVKPELLEATMLTFAGCTLMLTGSSAGSKWLASKSGVRVDQTNGGGAEPPKEGKP